MKFETVLIHFLIDVLVCCHPEILLPWQRDVTTSPLYYNTNYKLQDILYPYNRQLIMFSCFVIEMVYEKTLFIALHCIHQFKSKAVFDSNFQSALDYGFLVRETNEFRIPIVSGIADSLMS